MWKREDLIKISSIFGVKHTTFLLKSCFVLCVLFSDTLVLSSYRAKPKKRILFLKVAFSVELVALYIYTIDNKIEQLKIILFGP